MFESTFFYGFGSPIIGEIVTKRYERLPRFHEMAYDLPERIKMAFKVFDAYGAASRPTATLRVSGYVFLSKGILKRANGEGAKHAELMFDEETGQVGIRLVSDFWDDVKSPSIRPVSVENSGISVNLLPLLRFYGLGKPTEKHVLDVEFDEGMVIIDLSKVLTKVSEEPE